MAAVPAPVAAAAPSGVVPIEAAEGVDLAVIKSPIVGTFYRSSEPGALRSSRSATRSRGQVLCIIEAMKLMNEIECDCDGELSAVYAENGKPGTIRDRLFAVKVG
jgi:biotin carboxyl carrier protein